MTTQYTVVYLLKNKSDVVAALEDYLNTSEVSHKCSDFNWTTEASSQATSSNRCSTNKVSGMNPQQHTCQSTTGQPNNSTAPSSHK
jgi:hypothetical protein